MPEFLIRYRLASGRPQDLWTKGDSPTSLADDPETPSGDNIRLADTLGTPLSETTTREHDKTAPWHTCIRGSTAPHEHFTFSDPYGRVAQRLGDGQTHEDWLGDTLIPSSHARPTDMPARDWRLIGIRVIIASPVVRLLCAHSLAWGTTANTRWGRTSEWVAADQICDAQAGAGTLPPYLHHQSPP